MDQLELARLAREISKISFMPWHKRDKGRLKHPLRSSFPDGNQLYSYVINEWIPNQPDSPALMKLFILCGFKAIPFFQIIIQPPPGKKPSENAA